MAAASQGAPPAQTTVFPRRTGRGAGAVWYGIAPEWRADVDDWMSQEHMAEGIARPGGWRGRRYRCEDPEDPQTYLGLYETEDSAALAEGASAAQTAARSEWTERMAPHFSDLEGGTYTYTISRGAAIGGRLATLRFRVPDRGIVRARTVLRQAIAEDRIGHPRIVGVHVLEHTGAPTSDSEGDATASGLGSLILVEALESDGIDHALKVLEPALAADLTDGEVHVQRWQLIFLLTRE
jgi:hypothetical protein